jgi:hypothetical protein
MEISTPKTKSVLLSYYGMKVCTGLRHFKYLASTVSSYEDMKLEKVLDSDGKPGQCSRHSNWLWA